MQIDFLHFTPWSAVAGGALIGGAAAILILFNGRIAGISGILGGLLSVPKGDAGWRTAFIVGLCAAPLLAMVAGLTVQPEVEASWLEVGAAGLLVGVGTRYAGGCTSGHGVCGLSRGALRSLAATVTFMAAGFITVFVRLHWLEV